MERKQTRVRSWGRRIAAVIAAVASTSTSAVSGVVVVGGASPATAADAVGEQVVLQEDFSGGTIPAGWNVVNGNWRVQDGRLLGTGGSIVRITFGQHLENYRFDATVRFVAVDNTSRWQALALDIPANGSVPWQQAAMRSATTAANGLEFAQRTAANGWYVPSTHAAPTAAGTGTGTDVRVSVVVQGTHGEWWYNGVKVFETDGLLRSANGVQGFVVDGATVSYDNVRITEIDPLPPAPCIPSGATGPGQTGAVVAHRGDSAAYPENTMPALQSAFAKGADYVEVDIDWSADGVPFLMHDDTVDRTTDGTGSNHSLTIAQIRQLDAGSWKGAQFAGTPVPTLEELLAWMKDSGAKLLLEYKGTWSEEYTRTTRDLIERYGVRDQVIAQSFSTTTVDRLHEVYPELPTMILGDFPADPVAFTRAHHAIGLNPDAWPSAAALHAMRAAGLRTFVWTENSATAWAGLTALGVDGIITDLPGELVAWQDTYNATNNPEIDWCDEAQAAPTRGVLSSDEGWDTGLSDGVFNVTMDLWWGENATSFELYRDGRRIATVPLTWATPGAQKAVVPVGGLANGTYAFTGVLRNSAGHTDTAPLTVTVRDAAPAKPVLSQDNWDGDGSYRITVNLWWGVNVTGYRFFENGTRVAEGTLTAASPAAQNTTLDVTGRAAGTYRYTVEFTNAVGTTTSDEITVEVR
ncbi:hypothetical protein MXD63_08610 [Frankia sp. Cpl3]|nr:hypothetical protein [Frankia sp. Cpl3]